jgi:hypothetical protein
MGDYLNYTFAELQLVFCKRYRKVQNDEQVYLQLKNMKQAKNERVEVYYERLLKLANRLQHKIIDSFKLLFSNMDYNHIRVATTCMKRETL